MLLHEELTSQIIKCFYNVYNELGFGFLEQVYERALMIELASSGLSCKKQAPIEVFYRDEKVGQYYADIIVEDKVILELKATPLVEAHEFQLYNYLKATEIEVGILLSFGQKAIFKRKIFTNDQKKSV